MDNHRIAKVDSCSFVYQGRPSTLKESLQIEPHKLSQWIANSGNDGLEISLETESPMQSYRRANLEFLFH